MNRKLLTVIVAKLLAVSIGFMIYLNGQGCSNPLPFTLILVIILKIAGVLAVFGFYLKASAIQRKKLDKIQQKEKKLRK